MAFSILLVLCFGIIISDMNVRYSKSYDLGFNIAQINSTNQKLFKYANDSQGLIQGGDVNFNSNNGITITSQWALVTTFFSVLWDFLLGNWIYTIIAGNTAIGTVGLGLGPAGVLLAGILQMLYVFSIIAMTLYLFFRVKP